MSGIGIKAGASLRQRRSLVERGQKTPATWGVASWSLFGSSIALGFAGSAAEAATRAALLGFVKSCSRELGRSGSTAQLVTVAEGQEERLAPVMRYLLSDRSSFVSGQLYAIDGVARGDALASWIMILDRC